MLEDNALEENIKIEKVRSNLRFLSKTTYYSNIKIVLIDNAEYLNTNSSNALLKALEESNDWTYFFIIHNSANKILDTIKSRCIEFKFFFTLSEKKRILEGFIKQYKNDFKLSKIDDNFLVQEEFDELQALIMGEDFAWYYMGHIDYEEQKSILYICALGESVSGATLSIA